MVSQIEHGPPSGEPEIAAPFNLISLEIDHRLIKRTYDIGVNYPGQGIASIEFGERQFEGRGKIIDLPNDRRICFLTADRTSDETMRGNIIIANYVKEFEHNAGCWIIGRDNVNALLSRPHDRRDDAILSFGLEDTIHQIWTYEERPEKEVFASRLMRRLFGF